MQGNKSLSLHSSQLSPPAGASHELHLNSTYIFLISPHPKILAIATIITTTIIAQIKAVNATCNPVTNALVPPLQKVVAPSNPETPPTNIPPTTAATAASPCKPKNLTAINPTVAPIPSPLNAPRKLKPCDAAAGAICPGATCAEYVVPAHPNEFAV